MSYSQLWYYIPSDLRIPNPSPELRRVAVRIDGSVWVMPRGMLPWGLIHDLSNQGARVGTLDYADHQSDEILKLVRAALEKEVERIGDSLARSERSNARRADTNASGPERDNYRKRGLANLSRARRLLRDVTSAIERFGLEELRGSLSGAYAAVEARRVEMEVRAERYARAAGALSAVSHPVAQGLAVEARAETLPPQILADALAEFSDDPGAPGLSAALQEAFSE